MKMLHFSSYAVKQNV